MRGPLQMVAQVTGIEAAARAMDRFAASADRASRILDQLDAERFERLLESADRAAAILDRIDAERLDRLAAAAERAAKTLDRMQKEIGLRRVSEVLDQLESLAGSADQMNRSLRAIEHLAADLRKMVTEPLNRLPLPGRLRPGR